MITLSMLNFSLSTFWIETSNHLWQSTLFGLFIALLLIYFKKGDPGTRYIIGWFALLKFILPSSLLFLIFVNLKPASNYEIDTGIVPVTSANYKLAESFILINQPGTLFGETATVKESASFRGLPSLEALGLIWLVVALLIFGRWQYVLCRFLREIKTKSNPFTDSLNKKMNQLRNKIELRKKVRGYLIDNDIEPGSFGLFSPKIIIPSGLVQELTAKELELVLLHELLHIKHKDNIWSFLQKLFSCTLWYNPIVWWFNRHLVWESEKICDEGVLNYSEDNSTYAKSILKVTRFCIGRKILGYSGMSDINLEGRLENIVKFHRKKISRDTLHRFFIVIMIMFLVLTTAASGYMTHKVKPSINIFEAYKHYFLGRSHWNKRAVGFEEALMTAIKSFEQAIALDPNNALAYSGLADAYNSLPSKVPSIKKGDVKERAEEAAKKALALDPDLAEVHVTFGYTREAYHFDYEGAEKEFRRAIELNPKYVPAHHFLGGLLMRQGRDDESLAEHRKVVELEPLSFHYNGVLGMALIQARQYNAAIQQLQRTLELESNIRWPWFQLGKAYIYLKKYEDATHVWVRFAELAGSDKEEVALVELFVSLIADHDRTGEPVSPPPEMKKFFSKGPWPLVLYSYLGHKEKTIMLLEQTYEEGPFPLLHSPVYDFLRSEPRFIELIQKRERELEE